MAAVIPAAGQGKRMQTTVSKQFLHLQGMPVIVHTLQAFDSCDEVGEVVLVCAEGEKTVYEDLIGVFEIKKVFRVVAGGAERQDSVYNGLQAVPDDTDIVLVHDGARPLVDAGIIGRVIAAAGSCGAAVAAVPVKDTIKMTDAAGFVEKTLERSRLYQIQTPQGFRYDILKNAYEQARQTGFLGTDDAALVERLGIRVQLVPGAYEN
ncbi:MAG: 2-C-methyl-D-erythritol 4-phosphate cytidylyltransferase, partial [Bacillota bacterium]